LNPPATADRYTGPAPDELLKGLKASFLNSGIHCMPLRPDNVCCTAVTLTASGSGNTGAADGIEGAAAAAAAAAAADTAGDAVVTVCTKQTLFVKFVRHNDKAMMQLLVCKHG
jgi:hypothetical protein